MVILISILFIGAPESLKGGSTRILVVWQPAHLLDPRVQLEVLGHRGEDRPLTPVRNQAPIIPDLFCTGCDTFIPIQSASIVQCNAEYDASIKMTKYMEPVLLLEMLHWVQDQEVRNSRQQSRTVLLLCPEYSNSL